MSRGQELPGVGLALGYDVPDPGAVYRLECATCGGRYSSAHLTTTWYGAVVYRCPLCGCADRGSTTPKPLTVAMPSRSVWLPEPRRAKLRPVTPPPARPPRVPRVSKGKPGKPVGQSPAGEPMPGTTAYAIVAHVRQQPGVSARAVAEALCVGRSDIYKYVRALVLKGYLTRRYAQAARVTELYVREVA